MPKTQADKVLAMARRRGVLRTRDVTQAGLPRVVLTRLVEQGDLMRLSRGLYMIPEADVTEHHSLAEAARRVPAGLVCLLSALSFHGLTTQAPHEVWMAVRRDSTAVPQVKDLPLRIVTFSPAAFDHGQAIHGIERVKVAITTPAKTVADCFKFRGQIGTDVAIEALVSFRRERAGTLAELTAAAKVCRVHNVMWPYMEALT